MNIAQPVSTRVKGVGFAPLTSTDIKALSARRIQNPVSFDDLLNPLPGGLYDLAMGAFGDHECATCKLNTFNCPGHAGHIELPVVVYNITVMSQLLLLLRAKCQYCHHLRISREQTNYFCCKFRLIERHLLVQAKQLDDIREQDEDSYEAIEEGFEGEVTVQGIIERRNAFTTRCLKEVAREPGSNDWNLDNNWAVLEARRSLVKDFMSTINRGRKCKKCGGVSSNFRKDAFVKIFETGLDKRAQVENRTLGLNATNPLVELRRFETKPTKEADRQIIDIDEAIGDDDDAEPAKNKYITATEVHAALTLLLEKEREVFNLLYISRENLRNVPVNADMFFIKCLSIPPNKFRPELKTGNGAIAEDQQNSLYKKILTQCDAISEIQRSMQGLPTSGALSGSSRKRDIFDLKEASVKLQEAVNSLLDRDRNPSRGNTVEEGIKQKLEKKDGLFRKHMMGKRVNFAARSVISPDPNIETNEIGVPPVFAKKLTFPEPVTSYNFDFLRQSVINGPDKWPGAAAVENENGQVVNLKFKNEDQRKALADLLLTKSSVAMNGSRNKKVHRHLNNGDMVLMNRQPTLHKPSIMGHRARVLHGEKTIRMHYANCNTYNADFDGDEMNMHFPQNEIAQAEAEMIANTDSQYLASTAGKPLRGLIQDHISMGVWLTNRDTFFDRPSYHQLLYDSLRPDHYTTASGRVKLLPPAIMKPKNLWTGKQIVSTILLNLKSDEYSGLTINSKSTTASSHWGTLSEENEVIFSDGEMLCGILDKSQLGPSANGLVHSMYEAYSPLIAGRMLSVMGRLLTQFLRMRAFSCGIEDLVLTPKGDVDRRETLTQANKIGLEVAAKYVSLQDQKPAQDDPELLIRLEDVLRDEEKQIRLDTVMNARSKDLSSEITKSCLPVGLIKSFPKNQMQLMTNSGAKGSQVNANLISCNLGQQVLEGRRVPIMVSGKTLPCFKPYETNIRAGGYICDRFLTGIRTQEYYFHTMAGREGLIDTAVKTSRSGYLQRCLIKGMEGMTVGYDTTVRDSDGTMIQWIYGEDGLDVARAKGLTNFGFIARNMKSMYQNLNYDDKLQGIIKKPVLKHNKKALKNQNMTGLFDSVDPVMSIYNPGRYIYSTSEKFTTALKKYIKKNPDKILVKKDPDQEKTFLKDGYELMLNFKYVRSIIEPGEPVGIVAAQSIGEPSTQMTLNTFHLAGHSAKNVTLGIPRLREIVMTASKNIKTPLMALHTIEGLPKEQGDKFAKGISRLSLAEVIDFVRLEERVASGKTYGAARIYDIHLQFFPAKEYQDEYAIEIFDVARTLEMEFLPQLKSTIDKEHKSITKRRDLSESSGNDAVPTIGEAVRVVEEVPRASAPTKKKGDDDDEDDDDGDATNEKYKKNQGEAATYDAPDEEEAEIAAHGRRDVSPDLEDEAFGGSPPPDDDEERKHRGGTADLDDEQRERQERITRSNQFVTSFRFDNEMGDVADIQLEYAASAPKTLMLPLIERVLRNSVVQAVEGINGCVFDSDEYTAPGESESVKASAVLTTGVNLRAMHEHQHIVNPNRIFTNDVGAMLSVYGVEAARNVIVREMSAVFEGHGISVDKRHVNLIGDFMTRGGDYVAFNRQGITDSASPFAKMSFETTVAYLRDAVLERGFDNLKGPSARLVTGVMGRVGTGGFDILRPLPFQGKKVEVKAEE